MTVLVSAKINDRVVSASSFASGMVYRHADKIVNLRQGLPIRAMVTGAGGIGNKSIDTLLKDLRRRFNGEDEARRDWTLDPAHYTLEARAANREAGDIEAGWAADQQLECRPPSHHRDRRPD